MTKYRCHQCGESFTYRSWVCPHCSRRKDFHSRYLSGGVMAGSAVAVARKKGLLADPRTLQCADCGAPASQYDHRDYNKPLEVEPVCRTCNVRRGRAIPKVWMPGEWMAYLHRAERVFHPYVLYVRELHEEFKHELPAHFLAEPRA